MEHTSHLDVAELLLLVVALDEVAAAVALSEFGLHVETLHRDGQGRDRLEESIVRV